MAETTQKTKKSPTGQPQNPKRGGGKLRGLPKDSPAVRLSKTLSWLLRHGAQSEGLPMRADGFVKVTDLVRTPISILQSLFFIVILLSYVLPLYLSMHFQKLL